MDGLALPLCSAFLAFLGGLLFGLRVPIAAPWIAFGAAPILLSLVFHQRLTGEKLRAETIRLLLLAAMALAGVGHGAGGRLGAASDCRTALRDGTAVRIGGALAATFLPPRDSAGRTPLVPLHAAMVTVDGRSIAGCDAEVRVRLPRGTGMLPAGTEMAVGGDWRLLPSPVTPSGWPRSPAYRGFVAVDSARVAAAPSLARHPLLALRGRAELQLHRLFPRHGALADALLLGRREGLDRALADRFAQSGLVHLLAISGTHVALVGAVFVLLGRVLRLSRARVAALTIFLVAVYLAVIGAPPSALRSGIMMALTLSAVALQRPSAPLPIMAAAALVLLALDPMTALDAGFQLSFAGILGIHLLRGAMLRRVPESWREGKVRAALVESLVVSIAAFLATAPIVAHHFGQVAPVSILANLPAIPLTSLALIGIGAACVAEPFFPPLARLLADG
ncbi:MAG TPA: ComEC/Rec2 family competence protein, partial [Longimicrobium sp.]|nr:ComEC/Rec2 family competence protein [Longimicrobium sp.]